jgi:hypothetical protein
MKLFRLELPLLHFADNFTRKAKKPLLKNS